MVTSWPVVVVSMPFLGADRPSIQAGLLTAIAREHGFPARSLHANLDFAARIGARLYDRLAQHRGRMLGEWLFSVAAFGDEAPDAGAGLLDDIAGELAAVGGRARLLRIRQREVPAYLDELVGTYPWHEVRVAGFSCTFQQNTASFALARRLKQHHPQIVTVFGGANFDDEMGLEWVRTVDCVDVAIRGEADESFPRLLHALAAGADPAEVAGAARRSGGGVTQTPPEPAKPPIGAVPDYDEYFERAGRLGLLDPARRARVWIPIETSRGCWWGEKHHCTFCGLNGATMAFRSKPPERALAEMDRQARRYGSFRFAAVDNILDTGYLRTLLPEIAGSGRGYEIFYEVKANLRRDQVRLLARAGVSWVQPGLESLSSHVLALMNKGATAAQNINLLRWARYYGIEVSWNMLWGFPGETRRDYADQAESAPRLAHLQPPETADRIWLERFSPLFAERYSARFRWCRPERSYRYVYPPRIDLDRVAYFFDYELDAALPDDAYDDLRRAVTAWRRAWATGERPQLTSWSAPRYLQIYDGRWPGRERTHTFDGPAADVYAACSDRPISAAAVHEKLGRALPVAAVQEIFAEFGRLGLMFLDGGAGLALALPAVAQR